MLYVFNKMQARRKESWRESANKIVLGVQKSSEL